MTAGGPRTRAENAARREAEREARHQRWLEVELPRIRAAVRAEVERRGLASFMNDTRWARLVEAVHAELPFPPAFQLQPMLGERQPLIDPDAVRGWGAWSELQFPVDVEWLRVIPRYRRPVGRLVPDETVDATDAFRALLARLRIPFREDAARTFWIYGYAPADPATLTPPSEAPT